MGEKNTLRQANKNRKKQVWRDKREREREERRKEGNTEDISDRDTAY